MRLLSFLLAVLGGLVLPAHAQQSATPTSGSRSALGTTQSDTAQTAGPPPAFDAPPAGRALKGVVWRPGPDLAQAARTLRDMKAAGVEAVRTPLIRREALLDAADTLRVRLFQDLPAAYLSAGEVAEGLPGLRWELERALLMARRHPSARHFGLLSHSDTSVPATCAALRDLSERIRAYGPPEAVSYYETPFVEEDRCTGAADLVLLNTLNRDDSQALLRRWRQAQADTARASFLADSTAGSDAPAGARSDSVSVGIGALGTWVDPGAEGLRAPHSPQAQARYLERHLPPLLGDTLQAQGAGSRRRAATRADSLAAPTVVFAYRWRDQAPRGADAAPTSAKDDPYGRRYGLHDAQGAPRPAAKVMRGLYTGRQTVFAFDAGEAPPGRLPWLVLVGWGLAAVLGVVYASATRFRNMVQRYFASSRFYRDAVREGRDALGVSSFFLLAAVSLSVGLIMTVFLLAVQETGPFMQMLRGASGQTQAWLLLMLQKPWMLILIVAAFYLVSLGVWAFLLSLATQRSQPLRTAQTLVLVTWPRWPVFILAAAAVVAATLPPGWMLPVSGGLVVAWVLVSLAGTARALYDLVLLADLSPLAAPVLVLLNPVLLAAVLAFFAVLEFLPETTFLWHLALRA